MGEVWSVQCKIRADLQLPEGVTEIELASEGLAAGDTTDFERVVLRVKEPGEYEARLELRTEDEREAQILGATGLTTSRRRCPFWVAVQRECQEYRSPLHLQNRWVG